MQFAAGSVSGRAPTPQAPAAEQRTKPLPHRQAMRQGWLSNVLNPKAAVLLVTFVPQFVPAGEPAFLRSLAPMATCLRAFGRRLALSRH